MFGVGNAALDRAGKPRLRPVSFSYPVGDPGREDELIGEIATFWNAHPRWLSIENVPLLRDAANHATRADIPFQHAFENWLRALLAATHDLGARVALYGDGGDQLFAVSTVFLRDLFADFRWRELRREWQAFGGAGARELWASVARPVLEERRRARRGRLSPGIALPTWMNREFVERHALERRQAEAEASLAADGGGRAAAETRRSLANPTIPRVLAGFSALGLEHGVELRAPLLDRRLVEFAARRPRSERASRGAVKHLLRRTAAELLPPSVLAPRPQKTGVLTGYFARWFRGDPDGTVSDAFARSRLAELGIVDGAAMQQAWHEYKSRGTGGGGHLFVAFQTETWLRARASTSVVMTKTREQLIRMPTASFLQ
jgi:asparagine synthase (glutamine-hydrolysing)